MILYNNHRGFFFENKVMNKKVVFFTGGGSGGHVMPALTLIQTLKNHEIEIRYIGGYNSIESELVKPFSIKYYPIYNGKLRRYLSLENLKDFFKVWIGILQAFILLIKYSRRHTLVFSTGGFVSLPVVIAAWMQRKCIYVHEQTSRVGLANKIASIFAKKIFVSFEESLAFFPPGKTFYSGYPLRNECFSQDVRDVVINGKSLLQINKPILFVTGGGNGSFLLNELIKSNLSLLSEKYFIIHQVGKKFELEYSKFNSDNYQSMAFVGSEIIDIYKLAKVIISRAGAGTVAELLAIGKKTIFIPLKIAQKNEQYHNAMAAKNKLGSIVIQEDELNDAVLWNAVESLSNSKSNNVTDVKNGSDYLKNEIIIFTQL